MEWRDVERFFYVAQKEGVAEAFRRARRKWSAGAEGAAEYARWIVLSEPGEAELSAQRHERLKGPLISFLCPAYNTKESLSCAEEAVRLSRGRTLQELNRAAQTLRKVLEYARGNVSPAAVCGYLCWQLQ